MATPTASRAGPSLLLWAGLAIGAALVAAVLAGSVTALPVLLGTSVTRAGADVAGVVCVGLTLLGTLVPPDRSALPGSAHRDAARARAAADRALVRASGCCSRRAAPPSFWAVASSGRVTVPMRRPTRTTCRPAFP